MLFFGHCQSKINGVIDTFLAEREGFEPSKLVYKLTPLAGERLQPLGHLSGHALQKQTSERSPRRKLPTHKGKLNSRRHTEWKVLAWRRPLPGFW